MAENALEIAKRTIREQDEVLKVLTAMPQELGVVLAVRDDGVLVNNGGAAHLLAVPPRVKLRPGNVVTISSTTKNIIGPISDIRLSNAMVTVVDIMGNLAEVTGPSGDSKLYVSFDKAPKVGDRVMLDPTAHVIMENFGQPPLPPAPKNVHVSWDDIGGQEMAKAALREVVELPFLAPALYAAYGKRPPKGVLLSGPPGCGKTLLGKATATALAGNVGGFIHIKGPEILDPYVGVAEQRVRAAFANARAFKAKHGKPAILFVDEAEAILSRRGSGISSDMEKTIVTQFLTEMDGIEESGAVVILATNRPDRLDPAVVRDGRIDRKITVSRPTAKDAADIFAHSLRSIPTAEDRKGMAKKAADLLYSNSVTIQSKPARESVNGAMIVNIVEKATTSAMKRDLSEKRKAPGGLLYGDMVMAIGQVGAENSGVAME